VVVFARDIAATVSSSDLKITGQLFNSWESLLSITSLLFL